MTALLSLAGMLQNMLKPGDMLMLSFFFVLAWAAAVLLPKVLDMTRYLPELLFSCIVLPRNILLDYRNLQQSPTFE